MGFAKAAADRMIFMDEGMIIEEATPEELHNNPQHERTKLFLSKMLHSSRTIAFRIHLPGSSGGCSMRLIDQGLSRFLPT